MTLLAGSCFERLGRWRLGQWAGMLALVVGGNGIAVVAHALIARPGTVDIVRFLGRARSCAIS
jgi:uncharacterized membrane protein (DUF2068 family)